MLPARDKIPHLPQDDHARGAVFDEGLAATARIGNDAYPDTPAKAVRADLYLRENVKYALGEPEMAGLRRFYELAAEVGVLPAADAPTFY